MPVQVCNGPVPSNPKTLYQKRILNKASKLMMRLEAYEKLLRYGALTYSGLSECLTSLIVETNNELIAFARDDSLLYLTTLTADAPDLAGE